jgi:hypothetical protein
MHPQQLNLTDVRTLASVSQVPLQKPVVLDKFGVDQFSRGARPWQADASMPSSPLAALSQNNALQRPRQAAISINGLTLTLDQVARIAPVVLLHPDEAYLPCSAEYLLDKATLVDSDGTQVHSPTQEDLQAHRATTARLHLDPGHYYGEPLADGNLVGAPMYVSAQVPTDRRFVDLNFLLVFAYNGPQTVRVAVPKQDYTCVLPHIAEHEGDIEAVTMRVSADLQSIEFVRLAAHGHWTLLRPEDLEFEGTHPVIRCAYNSHATYNGKGKADFDWVATDRYRALGFGVDFIDITSAVGPRWAPFTEGPQGESVANDQLRFVGVDAQGAAISEQIWATFAGKIGAPSRNRYAGATDVGGRPLPAGRRRYADMLTQAVLATGAVDARLRSDGTDGLSHRALTRAAEPVWEAKQQ